MPFIVKIISLLFSLLMAIQGNTFAIHTPHRLRYPRPARYQPMTISPSIRHSDVPDTCNTSYDAVTMLRRELFIFKGLYLWRITNNGVLPGYPVKINTFFDQLPTDIDHIDAVYERPDNKIVFFIGREYYLFNANRMEVGYPKPLTNLGLPASLDKVDGAMIWGYNGGTYFFSGHVYWRFDESTGVVDLDYPREISLFAGVGEDIDSVFQWTNGKTYFFKDKGFWEFNDLRMRVENEEQRLSAPFWMRCVQKPDNDVVDPEGLNSTRTD